jgi:endo-1,4-beta-xylanase
LSHRVGARALALRRRALIAAIAALPVAGCGARTQGRTRLPGLPPVAPDRGLKSFASFPVGCAVQAAQLSDSQDAGLISDNFAQLTAEWEMKMEYILREDGSFRFDAPDAIAAFARDRGLSLFGHTLVWYAEDPVAFHPLDGQPGPFADALRNYILAVVGRYRGHVAGWDVVNEAVNEDGSGLRDHIWSRNLGPIDYMRRAFDNAREADPGVVLLINEYNLESRPRKRATFMRLVEQLLTAGAPVGGIGTQSHLDADWSPAAVRTSIRDLASLGLPIHVSELDISLNHARRAFGSDEALVDAQTRLAEAIAEAFAELPQRQRFGFTIWGLRDRESWLRLPKANRFPPWDQPLPFDDDGGRRGMFDGLAAGFARAR